MLRKIVDECGKNIDAKGQIDLHAVKKHVIKSQPPRVGDVPDLVEYCRVWGGLPTGVFVTELSTLCTSLPSDRIVSGQFLKWLANLKDAFSTRDLPSHFINSVAYTHAQASENIVDGFSRFISRGEVSSLGSKEKRDIVFEADVVLRRGRQLISELPQNVQLELIAKLKVDVVMAVLDRKGRTDVRSMSEIAGDFAVEVCNAKGITTNAAGIAQPPAASDQSSAPTNAIMYTDDGAAQEVGMATVVNKGFKVGNRVMKNKEDKCIQWVIKCIENDGTVKLLKLNVDGSESNGELVIVQLDAFLDEYKLAVKIETNGNYPAAYPRNNMNDMKSHVAKGKIIEIMMDMLEKNILPEIIIMEKPERKVISKKLYAIGALKLVPATLSVEVVRASSNKECPRRSLEIEITELDSKVWLHPSANSDDFVTPFWNCRMVNARKDANVELVTSEYKYKHVTCNAQFGKDIVVIKVITGVNFKEINVNDEIIIFKDMPEVAKKKRCVTASLEVKPDKMTSTKKQKNA
jgi:hypothetical protein